MSRVGASSIFPRPRTLVHPGRFNPVRINSRSAPAARHVRLLLEPGRDLFSALVEPLAKAGIRHASTTILGGFFDVIQYCVAPPDPSGRAVIAYGDAIHAGRSTMVFGNATIGVSIEGKPLVHSHAAIVTEGGRLQGGHMLTDRCIIGPVPIPVLVTALDGFELRQAFDPETNIPLLQPFADQEAAL